MFSFKWFTASTTTYSYFLQKAHITEDIKSEDIQNQIERNRSRWFEHVKGLDKHTEYQKSYWK